jgi:hypothetical protein
MQDAHYIEIMVAPEDPGSIMSIRKDMHKGIEAHEPD